MEIQGQDEGRAARIREAAKELFLEKGYDGTTMQAIADASSVNKALLHYYYQSKDGLFLLIFREELSALSNSLASIWKEGEKSLLERLEEWVDSQTLFIARAPRLPLFIISEMARNPELIKELLAEFLPPPHLLQPAVRSHRKGANPACPSSSSSSAWSSPSSSFPRSRPR